jgi:hypothetical protein
MAVVDVKYNHNVDFIGRNGRFIQSGISIITYGSGSIMLNPITSKNQIGNCSINIAVENLDEVIKALKEVKEWHDKERDEVK